MQNKQVMRKSILTKFIFGSLLASATVFGSACSKSKKADTTPPPVEAAATPTTPSSSDAPAPNAATADQVFFAFDSAELTVPGRATLDDVAVWVKSNPERTILIRGHADKSGGADYNLDLSAKRAQAVGTYLKTQGVAEGQIILAAVGETMANLDPEGANRRVVIFATSVQSSMK
jgi:outer membrane protein OmpA-like peptidoglycan-associated protein